MKKLGVILIAAVMTATFAAPSFAMLRKDLLSLKGTVTYINSNRSEITIKDGASGKDVTFSVSKGVGADISTGSLVLVLYKVGTTNAKSVRLVVPRAKRGAAMNNAAMTAPSAAAAKKPGY